mmetsp:Transcript_30823/g.98260  ORF Transcript_30823/g.98260 Transcript_30823/m.98260 type:complete len:248 (-) Transcript_30823:22-765(-)
MQRASPLTTASISHPSPFLLRPSCTSGQTPDFSAAFATAVATRAAFAPNLYRQFEGPWRGCRITMGNAQTAGTTAMLRGCHGSALELRRLNTDGASESRPSTCSACSNEASPPRLLRSPLPWPRTAAASSVSSQLVAAEPRALGESWHSSELARVDSEQARWEPCTMPFSASARVCGALSASLQSRRRTGGAEELRRDGNVSLRLETSSSRVAKLKKVFLTMTSPRVWGSAAIRPHHEFLAHTDVKV